jgi:leucyl aminopeptidase
MSDLKKLSLLPQDTDTKNANALIPVTSDQFKTLKSGFNQETQNWIKTNSFSAKLGEILAIQNGEDAFFYVGIDSQKDIYSFANFSSKLPNATYYIKDVLFNFNDEELYQATLGWSLNAYKFDDFKSKKSKPSSQLIVPKTLNQDRLKSEASSVYLIRDLINRPANDLGPVNLGKEAVKLAKEFNCAANVITGDELLNKDYPLIHTVGRASDQAPRLVEFKWGDEQNPKVTLVGKGITFDSGGLDIKPAAGMYEMKKDMGGAAHVLGLAKMVMEADLPVRLRVFVPIAENAVSSNAYRPSDVLKSREDKDGNVVTIENSNTDAEGRLIMADALVEASKENPELLLDFATLTGAQRVAHGLEVGGMISPNKDLVRELEDLGETIDDYLAPLPFHKRYKRDLSSNMADTKSSGGRAGSITAALFLSHFAKAANWVHFDISASNAASSPARPAGGEAMGVRTVFRYLENKFG